MEAEVREREKELNMLLVLKMEERAANQGVQVAIEAGIGKEVSSPLEPPEAVWSCQCFLNI